jgi:hypothetical protein
MDPHSRDLAHEEILEDIVNDAPDVEPAESPSSYLNPSGMEWRSTNMKMKPTEKAIAPMMEKAIAPLMEKPVDN